MPCTPLPRSTRCTGPRLSALVALLMAAAVPWLASCDPHAEPARVSLPLEINGDGIAASFQTDLGYTVRLTTARMAIRDVQFTLHGEVHAGAWPRLLRQLGDLVVGTAHAHPGHEAGGSVTGELLGPFLLDFLGKNGALMGQATLLVGAYRGANFSFRRADATDGLQDGDPLLGHSIHLAGTVEKEGRRLEFSALLDEDEQAQVIGVALSVDVEAGSAEVLGLQLLGNDPVEGTSPFDGIDFFALDPAGTGVLEVSAGSSTGTLLKGRLRQVEPYQITVNGKSSLP